MTVEIDYANQTLQIRYQVLPDEGEMAKSIGNPKNPACPVDGLTDLAKRLSGVVRNGMGRWRLFR